MTKRKPAAKAVKAVKAVKAGKARGRPKRQKAVTSEPVAPPLLTYEEVGLMLRVDSRTVRTWADVGRLQRVRLTPQTVRVTRESVDALIEAGLV